MTIARLSDICQTRARNIMSRPNAFPLDLQAVRYSYIERPNTVLLSLLKRHVLDDHREARILDVGCGAGANARALRKQFAQVRLTGIEPNAEAAKLAQATYDEVFVGTTDAWLAKAPKAKFDAVIMSDVLEHIPDPLQFLRTLFAYEGLRDATFIISVPNYAVWYNRMRTLAGQFEYAWSGLYDRTHVRFFTRHSVQALLEHAGLRTVSDGCTPSLVQSMAPLLRSFFEKDVAAGDHLSLPESKAFQTYDAWVEPVERRVCDLWPELLGFQIVTVGRLR
jgi:2-polyprenyl-3-methyl-5-hydroxy-6-metoxy-1,4-benzoquinol methylase